MSRSVKGNGDVVTDWDRVCHGSQPHVTRTAVSTHGKRHSRKRTQPAPTQTNTQTHKHTNTQTQTQTHSHYNKHKQARMCAHKRDDGFDIRHDRITHSKVTATSRSGKHRRMVTNMNLDYAATYAETTACRIQERHRHAASEDNGCTTAQTRPSSSHNHKLQTHDSMQAQEILSKHVHMLKTDARMTLRNLVQTHPHTTKAHRHTDTQLTAKRHVQSILDMRVMAFSQSSAVTSMRCLGSGENGVKPTPVNRNGCTCGHTTPRIPKRSGYHDGGINTTTLTLTGQPGRVHAHTRTHTWTHTLTSSSVIRPVGSLHSRR